MVTILAKATGTCGLCQKEGKEGVRCQVEGIGTLFLDWRCLQRMVALKSNGEANGKPVEGK